MDANQTSFWPRIHHPAKPVIACNRTLRHDQPDSDDALVPTLTSPSSAQPVTPDDPPTPHWDETFYNPATVTPTPRPPPRLAPMPKSPPSSSSSPSLSPSPSAPTGPSMTAPIRLPPPVLHIQTQTQPRLPLHPQPVLGPIVEMSDHNDPLRAKTRYSSLPVSHPHHVRSLSYTQAHSNHGTNVFTASPLPRLPGSTTHAVTSVSPNFGSISTMADGGAGGLEGALFPEPHHPAASTTSATTHSMISHASPAPSILPMSPLQSHYHLPYSQFNPYQHQHQHPHYSSSAYGHEPLSPAQGTGALHHSNPLLTPSSSQSSLFSNLPSPLVRSNHPSNANPFKDPTVPLVHPGHSSGSSAAAAASLTPLAPASCLKAEAMPMMTTVTELDKEMTSDDPSSSSMSSSLSSSSSITTNTSTFTLGGQRKIYPGLKNTVGPYKLLHSIGQGSFSEVKKAVDTRTGEHVAIKVMSRAKIQSSDRLGISVRRESDLLQSIQHPHIIGFREVVETSLQVCIVMDYVSGGELFGFIADKRPQATEADMQCIFAQIVQAVDNLHERNIVHRDLKPENVLLEPRANAPLRPKVKLTDFGLAKMIEPGSPLLTTRCGSEDYAAPEIILGQPYDGRQADIWSLGVLLYALLVGFLPFNMWPGMSRKSFLTMIAQAEFGFPGEKIVLSSIKRQSSRSNLLKDAAGSDLMTATGSMTDQSGDQHDDAPVMVIPKMRGVDPVSDEAKSLVRWLLQIQGSKRPTARQLYEHPWVAAGRQASLDLD